VAPAAFVYRLGVKGSAISEKNVCIWRPLKFRIKEVKPLGISMAMDQLIEEILAEIPNSPPEGQHFMNLDSQVPLQ